MVEAVSGIWSYIGPFLIVLTVLVFVHELGHYLIARLNGVRVEIFSIGFGPELFGWSDRSGTRWKVSAIPLGGYVKMFGDSNESSAADAETIDAMTEAERAVAFHCKRLGQRAAIVSAGPIANFLFAIIMFAGIYAIIGQPFTPPLVSGVEAGSAAERAGLREGDRVLAIDGRAIERFQDIQLVVQSGLGAPMQVSVLRGDETVTMAVNPDLMQYTDRFGNESEIGRLGIRGDVTEYVRHGPMASIWQAIKSTYDYSALTLKAVGQFISGTRSTKELSGPIGIAKMSGDVAQGGIASIAWFMAVLSINLGLINLFPIPVLDGGHLMFYAVEALRGRPLGERAQEYGFRFGLGLVLLLMLFVTWNDIVNIIGSLV